MHKHILISFFLLVFFSVANGQQKKEYTDSVTEMITEEPVNADEKPNDTLYVDTTLNFNRPFMPADSVKAWKEMKAFAYVKEMDSLLAAAKRANHQEEEAQPTRSNSSNWLERLFSSSGLQFFFWTLAVLFVLFILYKLFLTEGVFRKKTTEAKADTPEAEEEVITNESDLAILIRQALQNGNYRLAIRYQYLQTLFKLSAKKLIEMAADKTNHQYVREIKNANYQQDFAALTLNYEYVWYGEFEIDEDIYRRLESGFSHFNSKL